ncbi:HAD family hydrolase [Motilibacter aurantiacus]|uniref:HAD family hydrolase n=1 Tax=Motilibacter aurantiacus TaxID=2714955 RepID=UPI001407F709|nr:HAD family phosphatase [Motilibacter aurantiacus]NHC43930.1 HAD family phosphatase [Motilibacter aurantiacus]
MAVAAGEGVVFDMDGVLIESEELWDETRRGLAADAGRPWPPEATRAQQGMSTPEWSRYLVETVGIPGAPEEIARTVIDRLAAEYERELPLLPGAVQAVARLAERWPLGLASSSPRRLIDAVLHSAGLTGHFRVTLSTEEVAAGKPDPVVYRTVAERLGMPPGRLVAVEDSSNGLRAASAAGMVVVAVPHAAFPPAEDALALADVTLDRLAGLTPELVAKLLAGN